MKAYYKYDKMSHVKCRNYILYSVFLIWSVLLILSQKPAEDQTAY